MNSQVRLLSEQVGLCSRPRKPTRKFLLAHRHGALAPKSSMALHAPRVYMMNRLPPGFLQYDEAPVTTVLEELEERS